MLSDAEGPVLARDDAADARAASRRTLRLERLADEQVAELVEALAGPLDPRARAGHRPCGGKPVLRRGGARGPPRQRAARARRRRLVARRRGARSRHPGLRPRRPRRPHRPAAGRAKEALQAASVIGRSFSWRPGRTDRLERRGAHARGARLRPPHGARARLQARAHPRGRLRQPAEGERARLHAAFARWLEAETRETAAPARWPTTTPRRSPPTSRSSRGGTARTLELRRGAALAAARRRALAGAFRPRRRPLAASPRRRARAGRRRVWHAIGRVNALKFDGEAMWPAMERAIELTEGTSAPSCMRSSRSSRPCAAGCGRCSERRSPRSLIGRGKGSNTGRTGEPCVARTRRWRGWGAMREDENPSDRGRRSRSPSGCDDVGTDLFLACTRSSPSPLSPPATRPRTSGRRNGWRSWIGSTIRTTLPLIHWGAATAELGLGRSSGEHHTLATRRSPQADPPP